MERWKASPSWVHEQQPDHDQRNHAHSPSLWSQVAADVATSKPLVPSWAETVSKEDLEDLLNKHQAELRGDRMDLDIASAQDQPQQLQPALEMADALDAQQPEASLGEPEDLLKNQEEPMDPDIARAQQHQPQQLQPAHPEMAVYEGEISATK